MDPIADRDCAVVDAVVRDVISCSAHGLAIEAGL